MDQLQEMLNKEMAKIVVQAVERCAFVARAYGVPFPREYDFGLSQNIREDRIGRYHLHLRVRIDDYSHTYRYPTDAVDLIERWHRYAADLVMRYIDAKDLIPDEKASALILREIQDPDFAERVQAQLDALSPTFTEKT